MLMYETFFTFKKKFVPSSTVCRKATHHTSPQMFLSFPANCTWMNKHLTFYIKSTNIIHIALCTFKHKMGHIHYVYPFQYSLQESHPPHQLTNVPQLSCKLHLNGQTFDIHEINKLYIHNLQCNVSFWWPSCDLTKLG